MDKEKEATEVETDESSEKTPVVEEPSSQEKPKLVSKEDIEKEVTKRVSDELSARGDKVKPLEDRIKVLETDNVKLKDKEFATEAARYGLDVEKLKELGIIDSSKIEAHANLFGKVAEKPPVISHLDSGDTTGEGGKTEQEKLDKRYPTMKK